MLMLWSRWRLRMSRKGRNVVEAGDDNRGVDKKSGYQAH
jgi:hypothetical protein